MAARIARTERAAAGQWLRTEVPIARVLHDP
jgi:hypothetical protein